MIISGTPSVKELDRRISEFPAFVNPANRPEGVKKMETRASARKDRRLVETLGCGSSDVMGNFHIQ
jgi:hypothetical protein